MAWAAPPLSFFVQGVKFIVNDVSQLKYILSQAVEVLQPPLREVPCNASGTKGLLDVSIDLLQLISDDTGKHYPCLRDAAYHNRKRMSTATYKKIMAMHTASVELRHFTSSGAKDLIDSLKRDLTAAPSSSVGSSPGVPAAPAQGPCDLGTEP
eukprot:9146779-Alexandrium_andersonii.AAC.1